MLDWHEILGSEHFQKILGIKHFETLKKIFMNPTPSNIPWPNIQDLLEMLKKELGGRIDVVYGGRIRIKLDDGTRGVIHQANLEGLTAIGNVREIKRVIKSTKIMFVIVSTEIVELVES